ncbi:MAG: hypothetical protein HYY76_12335 [Acidobacteria bacterium]|nr:hypothetical protein [Acidobacteriota bacterium]
MSRRVAYGMLALVACGVDARAFTQQAQADRPAAPLVSVVGCARRAPQGAWTLTNATEGVETPTLFMSAKEIEEARKKALGTSRYVLLGTPEFLTKEELLKSSQRAAFTRPEVANATGQLQDGRKLLVKGLLIAAPNERRLNLVAVQQLAETCK